MANVKVQLDLPECIGCGACTAICPDYWVMEGDKSHIIGSKKSGESEELEIDESKCSVLMEVAQSCPVNCIHIYEGEERKI